MKLWKLSTDGPVAVARYVNPPMNYFCAEAMRELTRSIESWQSPEVRAVVLTGSGRAFSAGGDLGMIQDRADEGRDNPGLAHRSIRDTMRSG